MNRRRGDGRRMSEKIAAAVPQGRALRAEDPVFGWRLHVTVSLRSDGLWGRPVRAVGLLMALLRKGPRLMEF